MSNKSHYPWFYFFRIARLSLLVFIPTFFLILILYRSTHKEGLVAQINVQIEENLRILKHTFESNHLNPKEWCSHLPELSDSRYSIVERDGTIVCDSLVDKIGKKINDATEVNDSLKTDYAHSVRMSDIFKADAVFGTLKINDNLVIRKVVPLSNLKDGMKKLDQLLFMRILPFAIVSYLVFLWLFYRATAPLGVVLSKLEKFKSDLPFTKTLDLLYQKDRWAEIEEALNEADQQLRVQVIQTKTENEKIRAILESIYDNIIAVDLFETILFFNSNFEKNFKAPRHGRELMPKLWHRFTDEKLLNSFRSVMKTGENASIKGMTGISSINPSRFYDLTITPLRDPEGKITGALGVFYDMTEIKLTEQMRVDFVANVSHEIRTPLTSIKGYSQILSSQKNKMDADSALFLDKIVSNAERMISLFNDLLSLSVIESKNQIKMEELDLDELLSSIAENIKTNYAKKEIDVTFDLQVSTIHGDRRLMEQVLTNLIDNACKYSGDKINLKLVAKQKDNKIILQVIDDGPGISKEHIQRIFERFYRVDTSREISRGTGLGLSIVKHIIAKHGGRIWADSDGVRGTTFNLELPAI